MSTENTLRQTVAVLVPYKFIPPENGGQMVCYKFSLALSKLTKLFCVSTKQQDIVPEFEVIELLEQSIRKYLNPYSIAQLVRLFRRRNVWLCIVNQPYFAAIAYLACKVAGVKLIIYSHNLEYRRFRHSFPILLPIVFLIECLAYRLCDSAFFISKREKTTACRVFGLNRTRCFYVPIIAERPNSKNLRVPKRGNSFSIIFFGNFSYLPNAIGLNALLYEICPLLAKNLQFPYHIKIFGSGLPKLTETSHAPDHGLDAVTFMGYVNDLYPHIQTADVMINPVYTGAGSSMKIMDALRLGTTVVSARTGAEGISTKECGGKLLLVDNNVWGQYVAAILKVRNKQLNLLPTPKTFFDNYSEARIMNTVHSALSAIQNR